jgi:hypothetical protein
MRTVYTAAYVECDDSRAERIKFELSHPFKEGDEVYLSADYWKREKKASYSLPEVYSEIKGRVERIKTTPGTGACISVNFGGNRINIWHPQIDLIFADTAAELIYGA